MRIITTDRESIERGLVVRSSYIVISVHDPEKPQPRVPKSNGLRAVLYLAFHDAEPTATFSLPPNIRLMSGEQGEELRRFLEKHAAEVGAIVVHCEQGSSRSPAIAAATSRWLGQDDSPYWRDWQPNRHVFDTTLRCLENS